MASKLEMAFGMTKEEHSGAFERFANAFLIPDYPELEILGGKQDKAMDARIVEDGRKVVLVVQTCVSPATGARTKVLKTVRELIKYRNLPPTLVYCTPATIKLALDETKTELRRDHGLMLEVHDAPWFCARENFPTSRSVISHDYAQAIFEPVLKQIDPNHLYSGILSDEEERVAIQYLEAQSLDRARGGNLTKGIYEALVIYATRDSDPPNKVFTEQQIIDAICAMFPDGHRERIAKVVPGRIAKLAGQKMIHFNRQSNGFILSNAQREKLGANIGKATDRELAFRAALQMAITATAEDREIDYEYDVDGLVNTAHGCVLWYMHEQGRRFVDPISGISNVINAERLVSIYLEAHPPANGNPKLTVQIITDILPHALYSTLNSPQADTRQYLRSKADLFIMQAFLQVTPDVQAACQKILSNDVIYLDTTIIIRCIAEMFSGDAQKPLTQTLRSAQKLGIQLRTWRPYIDELVSHLKGPVRLEWLNHFREIRPGDMEPYLRTAPTLIGIFHNYCQTAGGNVGSVVDQIIGTSNETENAIEFLREELGVTTECLPSVEAGQEQDFRQKAFGLWLGGKSRHKNMSEARFELLVRNDVNAFAALVKLRSTIKPEGRNYGYKIWMLTLDRMPWRMPRLLGEANNSLYHVAMSLDYLLNYVSTLANASAVPLPDEVLPATAILDESEQMSSELRDVFVDEWQKKHEKKYVRERRVRDLAHKLKSFAPLDEEQAADPSVKLEPLPDEEI